MTDLATLKSTIADDLARTDLTAAIASEITAAIEYYQFHPFWFTKDRDATFSTVADQVEYTSSDDADIGTFYRLIAVYLEDGSNLYDLREMDVTEWQGLQDVTSSARPYAYSRFNESYLLYPTPNDAYTVRLIGHQKVAAPASDDETGNPWMNEASELIRARAVKNIYAKKLRSYRDGQIWQMEESNQLERLTVESNRKVGTGKITAMAF